jgi:hypothetical protein
MREFPVWPVDFIIISVSQFNPFPNTPALGQTTDALQDGYGT